ncbi:hypothetical protein HDV00_012549 [Rhizophlyctis rosea]|nr:hypothetical protein HDV00_012549 [Rhizophlyctis rosea]
MIYAELLGESNKWIQESREFDQISASKEYENTIILELEDGNPVVWIATVIGMPASQYDGGMFRAKIVFHEIFPEVYPRVPFACEVFHPQITKVGVPCYRVKRPEDAKQHLDSLLQMFTASEPPPVQNPDWFLNWQKDIRDGKHAQIVANQHDNKLHEDLERVWDDLTRPLVFEEGGRRGGGEKEEEGDWGGGGRGGGCGCGGGGVCGGCDGGGAVRWRVGRVRKLEGRREKESQDLSGLQKRWDSVQEQIKKRAITLSSHKPGFVRTDGFDKIALHEKIPFPPAPLFQNRPRRHRHPHLNTPTQHHHHHLNNNPPTLSLPPLHITKISSRATRTQHRQFAIGLESQKKARASIGGAGGAGSGG